MKLSSATSILLSLAPLATNAFSTAGPAFVATTSTSTSTSLYASRAAEKKISRQEWAEVNIFLRRNKYLCLSVCVCV